MYVIQAQCRDWNRLKPGFLEKFIVPSWNIFDGCSFFPKYNRVGGLGKPQKKVLLLMARPLRGGGVKSWTMKEKKLFLEPLFQGSIGH